jgi:predicted nucleic acid-binding protein
VSVVVDASVLAQLFLDEAGVAEAEALILGEPELLAPDIVILEVASALTRRVRRRELPPAAAEAALERLAVMPMRLEPHAGLLRAALATSLQHRHPVPDCLYLALATRSASSLATRDRALADLAVRLGVPVWEPPAP